MTAIAAVVIGGVSLKGGVGKLPGAIDGLNFMFNPDWSRIAEPSVWLAATGQIFFTGSPA